MTIEEYLQRLLNLSGVDEVEISSKTEDNHMLVHLTIPELDAGRVIGHRGETLAALQRVVRIVFYDELVDTKLVLDINDYRQQRTEQLLNMARNAAEQVLESGQEYVFPYLPSYERFIIHSAVSDSSSDGKESEFKGLETFSEGEGRNRRLVLRRAQ